MGGYKVYVMNGPLLGSSKTGITISAESKVLTGFFSMKLTFYELSTKSLFLLNASLYSATSIFKLENFREKD